jgi:hypothetical protein
MLPVCDTGDADPHLVPAVKWGEVGMPCFACGRTRVCCVGSADAASSFCLQGLPPHLLINGPGELRLLRGRRLLAERHRSEANADGLQ